jgi:glycosyltransferase involved in cell wall biosynthesis
MSQEFDLSIVIPCYNEEKNLLLLTKRINLAIESIKAEVILVDNGSTDGSAEILKKIAEDNNHFKIVTVEKNNGYGNGILYGLKNSRGRILSWTHADLQTDPSDILRGYKLIKQSDQAEKIYVKGLRIKRSLTDRIIERTMSIIVSSILGSMMHEINAQPNIFTKSFYDKWSDPPIDVNIETYAYYMSIYHKMSIQRLEVTFHPRHSGTSKLNQNFFDKWKLAKAIIPYALNLKKLLSKSN